MLLLLSLSLQFHLSTVTPSYASLQR